MPLYEYKCEKCKKTFEVLQKISSEPLTECIHCRGPVKKLISLSSFQFKGSGWYITDYKDKTKQKKQTKSTPAAQPDNGSKDKTEKKKTENKDVTQN
jgi:putative FmdB family regulatory protein